MAKNDAAGVMLRIRSADLQGDEMRSASAGPMGEQIMGQNE